MTKEEKRLESIIKIIADNNRILCDAECPLRSLCEGEANVNIDNFSCAGVWMKYGSDLQVNSEE